MQMEKELGVRVSVRVRWSHLDADGEGEHRTLDTALLQGTVTVVFTLHDGTVLFLRSGVLQGALRNDSGFRTQRRAFAAICAVCRAESAVHPDDLSLFCFLIDRILV